MGRVVSNHHHQQEEESDMNATTVTRSSASSVGVDIAKSVFQLAVAAEMFRYVCKRTDSAAHCAYVLHDLYVEFTPFPIWSALTRGEKLP